MHPPPELVLEQVQHLQHADWFDVFLGGCCPFTYWLWSPLLRCVSQIIFGTFFSTDTILIWKNSKFRSRKYPAYKLEKRGHSTAHTIVTFYKGESCPAPHCGSRRHCFHRPLCRLHLCILCFCKTPLCLVSFLMVGSGLFKPLAILVHIPPLQRGHNHLTLQMAS